MNGQFIKKSQANRLKLKKINNLKKNICFYFVHLLPGNKNLKKT